MNLIKKGFLSSFGAYLTSETIAKSLPFFLLPILTNVLTTEEFGILSNFNVFFNICVPVISLNGFTYLNIKYFNLTKNDLASTIINLVYQAVIISLIIFLVILLFGNFIEKIFLISLEWQILAIIAAFFSSCYIMYSYLLRIESKSFKYAILQITQSVVVFVVTIYFIFVLSYNWESRAYGTIVSFLCFGTYSIWVIKKRFGYNLKLSKKLITNSFLFGLPLLPHSLSFWLKSSADKIIITQTIGLSENGIYSIAVTIGTVMSLLLTAFFNTYSPWMIEKLSECDRENLTNSNSIKSVLVTNTYLFIFVLAVLCFIGYLGAITLFPFVFSNEYLEAIPLLPYIFIISFLNGLYSIISIYSLYKEKTKVFGIITFGSGVLQVVISLFLISNFGSTGALYSAIIANTVMLLAIFYYSQRIFPMPWLKVNLKFK